MLTLEEKNLFIFVVESFLILISTIHLGCLITQDINILNKKYLIVYLIVLSSTWLIINLMKYRASSIITLFLVIILVCVLIIIDDRKAVLNLFIGFLTLVIFFALLMTLFNGLFPTFVNNTYFLFFIFVIINVMSLITNFFITKNKLKQRIQQFWLHKINMGILSAGAMLFILVMSSGIFKKYIANISINMVQLITILFCIAIIGIILFLFNAHQHQLINERLIKKAELSNELKNYVTAIKSSRHEYNSHLVTIHQLVVIKQYTQLSKYVESLVSENDYLQSVATIKHPEISALLYRHEIFARKKHINLDIHLDSNLSKIKMDLYDLNKLLNNVLSNALEASLQSSNLNNRHVELSFKQINKKTIITVTNNGQIPDIVATKIFKAGITSKNNSEHGFGLFIIEQIVKDYNGSLSIQEKNQNVTVEITI